MKQAVFSRNVLAGALAVGLTACGGGGGGNTRGDMPPAPVVPPVAPPVVPPVTPPVVPTQPAINSHLALTNALDRQDLTGQGVRIGIVDSGVNRAHPTLAGRVVASHTYVDPATNNLRVDDVVGHGTTVAELAAGAAFGDWPGGIAPGAQIVSARIIADKAPVDDGTGNGNQVNGALGLAAVHQDLIADGVKIMNNSWGGLYWTNPAATAPIAAEYRPFITTNGGLVVFATGNESKPNPSSMAALPSQAGPNDTRPAADLEKGWLAVTAVNFAKPDTLSSYANACGVAANYCLAAPGESVFVDPASTGGTPVYKWGGGTSYAAPLVSGAAALVWQKYPYFSNDLVRQTLLGTATDLGAPGVDEVFGHGLLNVGKAINGPARFDWGTVAVTVPGSSNFSTWSNDISGAGGLEKSGAGTLVLGGKNSYTGGTKVVSGALSLRDGASLGSDVQVAAAGGLQFRAGTTGITGNVVNNGTLYMFEAGVTAVISGNYTHEAGAVFSTALGATSLKVTGTAQLNGGTVLIDRAVEGYVPQDGSRQALIVAAQGVNGQFANYSAVDNVTLLDATFSYDKYTAYLDIARVNVATAAATAGLGTISAASALRVEQAFGVLDTGTLPGTSGFAGAAGELQRVQGNAGLQASLDSLSGKAHTLATSMTFDNLDMNRRALSSRFDTVSASPRLRGAWQSTLGEAGQGSFAGSGFQTQGWMMGQDMALGSNGVLGFAFGETRSNSSREWGGDSGRDRQSQAQMYAGWSNGNAYTLGQLGAGQFTREIDRQLLLGAAQYGVNTRYSGDFSTASAESGYRFGDRTMSLTSYVGADYARVGSNGFSEDGGFGFGLRADSRTSSRSQALAGLRAETLLGGWSLRGYAEWQHTLSSQGLGFDASFVGVDAWAPVAGLQPARSGGLFGVSVQSWLTRTSQLSFGYDQRFGPRGDLSQVALRYSAAF
ncbi:autotransporter serine protease [Stenotrophomonas sp. VV52]|uniref:autotransporter serine protease n=1 Tax=Stenotrophomonas sp. VV52 TaxID=2066958 RepID=UPI000C9E6CFB|nr:autotransporter serine protease [Stenotrophomonas sp. VV52]